MRVNDLKVLLDLDEVSEKMYRFIADLFPICRSITGNGVRETLQMVKEHIPLTVHEVPTGTQVFDWTIPREWNIRDAYIKNLRGERIIDFNKSNLHIVSYSIPIHQKMSLKDLKEHLFTIPDYPDWIPNRTSYYKESWGFCLSHRQYLELEDEEYEVYIDSSLEAGHLTYGEYYLKGERPEEVLISCHICHPSLCNDNLSGIALVTFLAKYLSQFSLSYSYRFIFIPGTIGSITWLCLNETQLPKIKHGLVVTSVGDAGDSTYKKSRRGDADIDKAVAHVLKHCGKDYKIIDFSPYGYDERQFCSPAFNLPVGCLMRTLPGTFPEYHTSADNLDFVQPQSLADSFAKYLSTLDVIEHNQTFLNQNPKCEPQLGKRGLYGAMGGQKDKKTSEMAMLWILNLSDGEHTLLDIADRAGLGFELIKKTAATLVAHDLLQDSRT